MMKNLLTGMSEVQADLVRVSFIWGFWRTWRMWTHVHVLRVWYWATIWTLFLFHITSCTVILMKHSWWWWWRQCDVLFCSRRMSRHLKYCRTGIQI